MKPRTLTRAIGLVAAVAVLLSTGAARADSTRADVAAEEATTAAVELTGAAEGVDAVETTETVEVVQAVETPAVDVTPARAEKAAASAVQGAKEEASPAPAATVADAAATATVPATKAVAVVAPGLGSSTPPLEKTRPVRRKLGNLEYEFNGNYRVLGWNQSDIALGTNYPGEHSDLLGRQTFFEHRLRAGSTLRWSSFEFELEFDVLNGLLNAPADGVVAAYPRPEGALPGPELADPLRNRSLGLDFNSAAIRKAYLTWKSPIGNFSVGPTTFTWGTGMLSNGGGAQLDDQYGDQRFGDRTFRAMYATKPLYFLSGGRITEDFTAGIGADFLLQDETGRFRRADAFGGPEFVEDLGVSGIFVLRHARGNYNSGLFVARRQLWFPHVDTGPQQTGYSTDLGVWAFDFFVEYKQQIPALGGEFYGAFEGVHVTGDTNHVRNLSCSGQNAESRCNISQQGAVAKVGVVGDVVGWELLGGYASGDGNPFDENVTNFRFDRDFKVGLILFDQVMAWQSAAAVRRAADPELTNGPAAGVDLLSTGGSVTNAIFIQPTVRARLSRHLTFRSSVLWARSPQRYTDPLWTNRNSAKTNAFGAPAGQNYGVELDVGLDYRRPIGSHDFIFGVHGGYFAPGNAFEMADGVDGFRRMDPVYLVKARTGFVF